MKKVIAAAAGLMLAGALVGTASAAVTFGGDARVRTYYQENYDLGAIDPETGLRVNENDNTWSSRVRIVARAESKGGAYARARIRIADTTWDGTALTRDRGAGTNAYWDYAYIGVPLGAGFTIEGGLMPTNLTKFFYWDNREDQLVVKWGGDMTTVQLWYAKRVEFTGDPVEEADDNDVDAWFLAVDQKFAGDFGLFAAGAYVDDQTAADASGFTGTIQVGGPAGPVALEAALAYVESDLTGNADDGYGGYIQGGFDLGVVNLTVNAGWVQDGFAADNDFGFIMIGGASSITPGIFDTGGKGVGALADTTWIGGTVGFKVSEALSLKGNLVYADLDTWGTGYEVSGSLSYVISDGAVFTWDIGYLGLDADDDATYDDSPFGTALTVEISY